MAFLKVNTSSVLCTAFSFLSVNHVVNCIWFDFIFFAISFLSFLRQMEQGKNCSSVKLKLSVTQAKTRKVLYWVTNFVFICFCNESSLLLSSFYFCMSPEAAPLGPIRFMQHSQAQINDNLVLHKTEFNNFITVFAHTISRSTFASRGLHAPFMAQWPVTFGHRPYTAMLPLAMTIPTSVFRLHTKLKHKMTYKCHTYN